MDCICKNHTLYLRGIPHIKAIPVKAAGMMKGLEDKPDDERLRDLRLFSLGRRRQSGDLMAV